MKTSYAFCYSHHVFTSMKKVVKRLVKTPKNLYVKRKKHIHWIMIMIKSFLPLNQHCHSHPKRKSYLKYQIYLNGVTILTANVLMPSTNIAISTCWWETLSLLFATNLQSCVVTLYYNSRSWKLIAGLLGSSTLFFFLPLSHPRGCCFVKLFSL